MHENLGFLLAAILVLGIGAQWLAWRLKLPSILFLLLLGVLAGPVSGFLNPDEIFGDLLFPTISLGVAIVLFEGALTLRFADIREQGVMVSNLVTWGAVLNWLLISAGTWYFIDFSISMSLLFGALVVVTGPTVVSPLLRNVRPVPAVGKVLRWEGILIDPIGAILAVLVFEAIISDAQGGSLRLFFSELAAGGVCGAAGALLIGYMLRRHLMPEYLHSVVTLAAVVGVFAISNQLAHESGLLAVTVMGVWLANTRGVDISDILSFKESLSVLIVSLLFILLVARLQLEQVTGLGIGAVGVLLVVLLARPVMVWASAMGSKLDWKEKALISWIAPRGIVAAAVSSLFAIKLGELGVAGADTLAGLTFLIIIVTVILQSITASPVARLLGLTEEEAKGVLILGGNNVALAIGKALLSSGFRVKLASSSWSEIQTARMEGLETYFGNPVSAHADRHLDLMGIGRLLAMSRRPALNTLASMKYASEFGRQRVFTLRTSEEKDESDKARMGESYHTQRLFGGDVTIQKLASLLGQGAEIKSTRLSDSFTMESYREHYGKDAMLLFGINPEGRLRPFTDEAEPEVGHGWVLVALLPKAVITKLEAERQAEELKERAEAELGDKSS
ncbi:MAG: sodium:proton antiporter [Porticoccaceae bacterium]|nr:sodium:proton antiporter [Porticoccaceae bacterium]